MSPISFFELHKPFVLLIPLIRLLRSIGFQVEGISNNLTAFSQIFYMSQANCLHNNITDDCRLDRTGAEKDDL